MWVLIGVMLAVQGVGAQPISPHATMEECFEAREEIMEQMPEPKINYEFVCVRTDLIEGV